MTRSEIARFNPIPSSFVGPITGTKVGTEKPRLKALGKLKAAQSEAKTLFGMAQSWTERLSVARLMADLHIARVLPVDSYSWDAVVRLHGSTYWLGLRTSEIYVIEEVFRYKMYDRKPEFLAQKDWVVFDIGANIGVVSVLHAQRNARVYAFEPNPDCYRRLLKNITANSLEHKIRPFNLAVGDTVGTGSMQVEKGGTTGGTVLASAEGAANANSVDITTLDSIVPALRVPRIDLLKIDVEGAEIEVLRGANHTLTLTRRIMLEYHSRSLLAQAEQILIAHGFVRDTLIEYYPEDLAKEQEEVGITYYSRPANAVS